MGVTLQTLPVLLLMLGVQLVLIVVVALLMRVAAYVRLTLALRLDRGLAYSWHGAARRAAYHLANRPW
jgi:hypothetical protein